MLEVPGVALQAMTSEEVESIHLIRLLVQGHGPQLQHW